MTYLCSNCGGCFDAPFIHTTNHGLPHYQERSSLSPCCREVFTASQPCARCGAPVSTDGRFHGLCQRCAQDTLTHLRRLLHTEFIDSEREVLNDAFDGVPLTQPEQAHLVI